MDANPKTLAKLLIPRLPLILKTTALHSLGQTDTSHKWDLKTELIIKVLRSIVTDTSDPKSISASQKASIQDPGIKGPMWISKVTLAPPPEDDICQILFKSIDEMKTGDEAYTKPELLPVEAEWTGYRAGASENEPELPISETEKYEHLMKEVTSNVTILYFHGGAYYMLDPASHRGLTSRLAKLTSGRVLSVRYRLSPHTAFPGALLDALHAYLSLLHPPPGSPHRPVPASQIVFAGDSAGANLASALMQLLLQINRSNPSPSVQFHGQTVEIPLPAGMALNSPWLDITRCMPSLESNAKYDYLPTVAYSETHEPPPCSIWPANPPRTDLFCEGSALCHPLVSPLAAMDWTNCPPVFITIGEEMLADENQILARRLAKQGVRVPITLTLQRGKAGDAEDIAELSNIANAYSYDFVPEPELEDGDDYLLRLSQGMIEDFSPVFAVYDGRKAATTASPSLFAAESSTFVTSTRSTAATTGATTTSFVAEIPSAAAKSTISSSDTVEILVPIPTSSFDAPREEDSHLTSNDKFALGFGIPITLIILSTLGYWRATKYFLHHKVTGGLKLPVYGPVDYARAASKPDFRGRWISQPASLWGAASRPGSVAPSTDAFSDSTELTTAPNITRINADAKLSQGSLHAPSTLQQEWRVL
ncbi:hypothetical protein BLS_005117 [Venturia inaequalis]|uniref:Alpha/beta hydrolase fold-3 domain-containing protein n=1 Tax=Venturia inaequalis TaxID=5025 RepID=A0A8H3YQZ8_VENIN|nr:hypothetical protein BLS_005117 [Venturia inaequalis]